MSAIFLGLNVLRKTIHIDAKCAWIVHVCSLSQSALFALKAFVQYVSYQLTDLICLIVEYWIFIEFTTSHNCIDKSVNVN